MLLLYASVWDRSQQEVEIIPLNQEKYLSDAHIIPQEAIKILLLS